MINKIDFKNFYSKIIFRFHSKNYSLFIKKNFDVDMRSLAGKKYYNFFKKIGILKKELKIIEYKILKNIPGNYEAKLKKILDSFFIAANNLEAEVNDKSVLENFKKIFRYQLKDYLFQSDLLKYAFLKPKGYPGDYDAIEAIYDKIPISKDLGYFLDKYFLEVDYVQAVRDRKNRMKKILHDFIENNEKHVIRILNIACGSCREIRELIEEGFSPKKKVIFYLVDQEKKALEFSKNALKNASKNFIFKFVADNILNFIESPDYMRKKYGKQDLIYSIGLADYLPDSILGPLIKYSFNLLSKKSYFLIAHKNVFEYASPVSEWCADWNFIPRKSIDLKKLIKNYIDGNKYFEKYFKEKSGRIFFFTLSNK